VAISLRMIHNCLLKANLLKEFITPDTWQLSLPTDFQKRVLHALSYDSRKVSADTLFFCKGLNFKEEYLVNALADGLEIYVAETPYEVNAPLGIIVTDIKKAMAVLSMAFYDYPQNKLKLIGFTGTKGKTTAAYFTKYILDQTTQQKTALLSTMNSTLDGKTFFKSTLTTPESLDLYKMMAEAVTNGMTHLVMEVSSQAYKTQRVYGLIFDVGIFLNITPDHISPIEHPTFDDYFYCKRQLITHAKTIILNRESNYFPLLKETAQQAQVPAIVYGRYVDDEVDYCFTPVKDNPSGFTVTSTADTLKIAGNYTLQLGGDFNKGNALSAALASALLGATKVDCQRGIAATVVPGRMESLTNSNGATIYVDYAHNYDSVKQLLTYVRSAHPTGRLIIVIGSTGDKAVSRRKGFGQVLTEFADIVVLTTDDPASEDPAKICQEIESYITAELPIYTVLDREAAIEKAIKLSHPKDAVVLAGKGADLYQKVNGVDVPYDGDFTIAQRLVKLGKTKNV